MTVDPGARRRRARGDRGVARRRRRRHRRSCSPRATSPASTRSTASAARRRWRRSPTARRRSRASTRSSGRGTSTSRPRSGSCYGQVDIDSIAGPSEVLIIADGSADAGARRRRHAGAGRARPAAPPPCASRPTARLAARVAAALDAQLADAAAPGDRGRGRWRASARSSSTRSLAEAVALANRLAPEHLELLVRDPRRWLPAHPARRRDLPRAGRAGGVRRLPRRAEPRAADRRHGALRVAARRLRLRQADEPDRGRAARRSRRLGPAVGAARAARRARRARRARSSAGSRPDGTGMARRAVAWPRCRGRRARAPRAGAARGPRRARSARTTKETDIRARRSTLDGSGRYEVETGIPFLDHMLELFARHGFFDLTVQARGDLEVDYHHTVEDVGLVLGQALREALGDKAGIRRFGEATVPLDEALVHDRRRPLRPAVLRLRGADQAGEDRHLRRRADPRLPARAHQPGGHEPARPHGCRGATRTTSSRRRSRRWRARSTWRRSAIRASRRAVDEGHARRMSRAARHRRLRRRQPAQRAEGLRAPRAARRRSPATPTRIADGAGRRAAGAGRLRHVHART